MFKAAVLSLVVVAGFVPPSMAGNIHQEAARCLAGGGADCDSVCLACHPGVSEGKTPPQEWNSTGVNLTELTGENEKGRGDDLGDFSICVGCHDAKMGANNHPTGVLYPRDDREYTWIPAGPKLFCDEEQRECRIFCSTCHNPHASGGKRLLRMSNTGSALCLACHIR